MKRAGPFEIVTSVVVARSVVEPLGPSLKTQMDFEEAFGELYSALEEAGFSYSMVDRASLVYDGSELVGWYTEDMSASDLESVGEVMHPIYPDELVSADTSVFKLVQLLVDRPKSGHILFVLDQDAIIGTISRYGMFHHPVFRLCLFALSLELEEASLSAAMVNPLASWNALSPARRAKAQEVHDQISAENRRKVSLGQKPWGQLLASTTIADKGRIVAKLKLLPGRSRSEVESLFTKVERVRNWCAHTSDSRDESRLNLGPMYVARFVASCTEAISTLRSIAGSKEGTS